MSDISPLFKKLVSGYTFGELPKEDTKDGVHMVQTVDGEWLPKADCILCPQGEGKLVWVKR